MSQHRITVEEDSNEERTYWECSCGRGGSYPWENFGNEEKHIPTGEHWSYVHVSPDREI